MPVRSKDLSNRLPTRQQFLALVNAIRTGGGRFSKASTDLVEFLAYTDVRLSEARWIQWRHCDFIRGEIVVAGDPVHATRTVKFDASQ